MSYSLHTFAGLGGCLVDVFTGTEVVFGVSTGAGATAGADEDPSQSNLLDDLSSFILIVEICMNTYSSGGAS
jgi:hypothetical protein